MRWLVAVALFALLPFRLDGFQIDQETWSDVDVVFAEFNRTTGPGCAVGIVQDGSLVFERGYGIGNLDHSIPLSSSSVFYLASVSKQFAAAAVLMAAHEGFLTLDDDVREHLPEFPDYGLRVTVRNLVHHTSGVRDYLQLMFLAGIPIQDILSDEDMLGLIVRQEELNFTPGSEHLYSNSGYVLLAEILKRVTGRSLREYADEKIFEPLGMMDTHFHDDSNHVVQDRVFSYDEVADGSWATNYLMNFDKVGDGGLYSTVEDLARWDAAFYDDALALPNFAERMYERGVLSNGDTIAYAHGLGIETRRGLERVSHGGGLMAFRTMIARYPHQRTTVITLCNVGSASSGALSTAVEDIVLKGHLEVEDLAAPKTPESVDIDPTTFDAYEGNYELRPDLILSFRRDADRFFEREVELFASSDSTFFVRAFDAQFTFHRGEDGRADGLTLHQNGDRHAPRVDREAPSAQEAETLAGRYYSRELEASYVVRVEDGLLILEHPTLDAITLVPIGGDQDERFYADGIGMWRLSRDETGRVTEMLLSSGRVRNLRFVKQE